MARWAEFEQSAPDLAASGRRRLVGADGGAIGFIATVSRDGLPRMAPVCPIFCERDVYLSVGIDTPKKFDLLNSGRYVLHAFLGENDEEFQIAGRALLVKHVEERERVHASIQFSFKPDDPVFRLEIDRCLWGYWENVGKPDTRPVRRRWRAAEPSLREAPDG
jgi:hypothetical protein